MLEYPKVYVSSYARIFFAPYVQTETNSCKEKKMLTNKQIKGIHYSVKWKDDGVMNTPFIFALFKTRIHY